ncbi:hypothetical protein [Cognatishimia maritima]|uniref:Uncharacterized protein n=1 Tax=Cognatishimia maritima TaxID=870908 RepID=A0A1M5RWQ6_9RHOB|nr:hypothetical protein [Cognatishimia maritima]SHH30654.1 hypothetical protein SAMN04488044_2320 [Cognatishimia maritima]
MTDTAHKTLADALGFKPGVTLRTFGMRRSGNHAIINWLQRNSATGSAFLNNCAVGRPARRTWRSIEINGERVGIVKGDPLATVTGGLNDGAMVIVSYEDFSPDPDEMAGGLTADLEDDAVSYELLIYRNFMNWAASLLRKLQANEDQETLDCLRIMMVSLAKYRDMLELVLNAKPLGLVPVNYDRWVTREPYRESLLNALGLPCRDNSLGDVQPYGGGSSFQKDVTDAQHLEADNRWPEMANDAIFQIVLLAASQDHELLELMRKLMPRDAELLTNYLEQAEFPYLVQAGGI